MRDLAGASDVVQLFLDVLGLAAAIFANVTPDPDRVVTVEVTTRSEVVAALSGRFDGWLPLDSSQLYALLEHEPAMWGGSRGISEANEWRWELTRSLRRFGDVASIGQYLDVVAAIAAEHARAGAAPST